MKKVMLGSVVIILCVVGVMSYMALKNNNEEKIVTESEAIAKGIINLYKGDESFRNDENISLEMRGKIESYLNELKLRDNLEFEIEKEPLEVYDELPPPEEVDPDAPIPAESSEEVLELVPIVRENTAGFYEKNENTLSIKVNDIIFSDIGYAELIYNNIIYSVYLKDMPETYLTMKNNPEYIYKYVETVIDENEIRVYYKSIISEMMTCIRVQYKGSKVVDFVVE